MKLRRPKEGNRFARTGDLLLDATQEKTEVFAPRDVISFAQKEALQGEMLAVQPDSMIDHASLSAARNYLQLYPDERSNLADQLEDRWPRWKDDLDQFLQPGLWNANDIGAWTIMAYDLVFLFPEKASQIYVSLDTQLAFLGMIDRRPIEKVFVLRKLVHLFPESRTALMAAVPDLKHSLERYREYLDSPTVDDVQ